MKKLLITSEQLVNPSNGQCARYQVCAVYEDDRMIEVELHQADTETILNNIYGLLFAVRRFKTAVIYQKII